MALAVAERIDPRAPTLFGAGAAGGRCDHCGAQLA